MTNVYGKTFHNLNRGYAPIEVLPSLSSCEQKENKSGLDQVMPQVWGLLLFLFLLHVQKSQMIIMHRCNYLSCYKNYPGKGN